jgi:DNA-binding GntR family transcriptional regulator
MTRKPSRQPIDENRSPRDLIVRDLIKGLYEGRYLPGQRLVEADLTAHYRVSRGPVREALNWLAAHGIVSLTLQRGAQVRRLSREEAVDILVIVESLIGLAACLAAIRARSSEAAGRLRQSLLRLD